jgi:hypothetical protein
VKTTVTKSEHFQLQRTVMHPEADGLPAASALFPSPPFQAHPLLFQLSRSDQSEFLQLASFFAYSEDRSRRNLGISTFVKHLAMVHSFVCRGDPLDALRGAICGIQFGIGSLLINISHLKKLMSRSKSCMNGCFQRLGYNICRPAQDAATLLSQILPGGGARLFTARCWSARRAGPDATIRFLPNAAIELGIPERAPQISPKVSLGYDIQDLLNHQQPDGDILRMPDVQQPFRI